ncbi:alpha/beta fold hydrolase [Methylobacterium sp. WSM2598]|uniref:alpha/beta fold hydrolase n=1 Tax=Methylobacterium sp. WSM2598 TaxID=398261 RepID=UPI00036BF4A1|nr:alpha/beta fold hydrolase [Methylobacterium sp. WSM2598]
MRSLLFALVLLALPGAGLAEETPLQRLALGDLPLESGEVIRDFSIAYTTEGTLNAAKSNAVLMVTAISGNHHRIDFMIGPGKGLDTDRLFVIKTNAIGNGLTTSPSTSTSQHGPDFPHFSIRDMVESQHRLLQHLGITHLVAVAGASMGGMQVLQWGVSHPEVMDGLVALTPMARTTAWSIAVNHATRQALMLDPAFQGGRYTKQPEAGWRMRADVLQVLATRTPEAMRRQFAEPMDVVPWITAQEDAVVKSGFDANDWIAQTWAYDRHNVGDTKVEGRAVFGGDPLRALRSIKAKALLMSGMLDLYNPVENGIEAAQAIPDGRHLTIPSVQGHVAASPGFKPADLAFINATVRNFMQEVTKDWTTTR